MAFNINKRAAPSILARHDSQTVPRILTRLLTTLWNTWSLNVQSLTLQNAGYMYTRVGDQVFQMVAVSFVNFLGTA